MNHDVYPVRARRIVLDRQVTVGDAFVVAARACLDQLRANKPVVIDTDDPEGVHQMRVALRRLRTLTGVFSKAVAPEAAALLKERCRWLHGAIEPARDWDVFLFGTLDPLIASHGDDPALAALKRHAVALRDCVYCEARRALARPEYTEFLLRFDAWLETGEWGNSGHDDMLVAPALPWAKRRLHNFAKRLHQSVDDASTMTPAELHGARINVKKLRYASEFFRSLFQSDIVVLYIGQLRKIQDLLGKLNDVDTGRKLGDVLERRLAREGKSAAAARAAGLVQRQQSVVAERELVRFRSVWTDYLEIEPFWDRG